MKRNREVHNEVVHLGGVMLDTHDPARLFGIAQVSVCRVSMLIGDREIGHGSSFVYKQMIGGSTGSRIFFFTNAHVIEMIYGAYEVLPLLCDEQTIRKCPIELTVNFGGRQYPIKHAWVPKIHQQKTDDLPFMGDYAIFPIESDGTEELDFFGICSETLESLCGGQDIYACGFPGPAGLSVRKGVISNLGESGILQHDVMINPGDSGGPTLMSTGQVVGISVGITDYKKFIGINYSMNMRHVLEIVKNPANMERMDIQGIIERIRKDVQFRLDTSL